MSTYNKELYHHGIIGMKWGVRRYQNSDGSLTNAGKKRYNKDAVENNWEIGTDGIARSTGKKNSGEVHRPDPNKWVKEDITRSKQLVDAGSNLNNQLKTITNQQSKTKKRMNLKSMSDKELREKINRELLERQYNDMFNTKNVNKGKKYTKEILDNAGVALGITSSALAIALAIKELKG